MAYNLASAVINSNANGDNVVINGVTGRRLRVYGISFTAGTGCTITMYSDAQATGTALSGPYSLLDNGSISLGTPTGNANTYLWETDAGKGFNLFTSLGSQLSGTVYYQAI